MENVQATVCSSLPTDFGRRRWRVAAVGAAARRRGPLTSPSSLSTRTTRSPTVSCLPDREPCGSRFKFAVANCFSLLNILTAESFFREPCELQQDVGDVRET